jgi:hypothetical protein
MWRVRRQAVITRNVGGCLSRRNQSSHEVEVERARDELFSHIHRCGVLKAEAPQQVEWMEDTVGYLRERFPELKDADLEELRGMGLRFCQPVIEYGEESNALIEGIDEAAAEVVAV